MISIDVILSAPLIFRRSNQDIVNQAVLEVSDRVLYDVEKMRRPVPHGALDTRLVESFRYKASTQ
jgi:hypothetical protein